MLRCVARYRNVALDLFVEPGEVLRNLSPETEAFLLRDAPGCFVAASVDKGLDAPPRHKMVTREQTTRKQAERGHGPTMTRQTMPGLTRDRK